ncbi:MAG: hypothetical protein U5L76_00350 [Patescibacteria group bacterium]|nr:hypothetical protein [Patescibacteria group bacterium]
MGNESRENIRLEGLIESAKMLAKNFNQNEVNPQNLPKERKVLIEKLEDVVAQIEEFDAKEVPELAKNILEEEKKSQE